MGKVSVICGLGFGDCGKGVTTNWLCSQDPDHTLVVRFSGGHQCGHKVIEGRSEHIFSNLGSGTLLGCPTYWSGFCTFEPIGFCKEQDLLLANGYEPVIFIHPDSMVTTPYDIYTGRRSPEAQHGSTGTGFKRTLDRNQSYSGVPLTFRELINLSTTKLEDRLVEIKNFYRRDNHDCPDLIMDGFLNARFRIKELMSAGLITISSTIPVYKNYVCEGNQGLLLDEKIGWMPHCTPSSCTPENVIKLGLPIDDIYLVTRCYQTRHGNGPMSNVNGFRPLELRNTEHETNVENPYQGVFRKSVLDLDYIKMAKVEGIDQVIGTNKVKEHLVITCMDQMDTYMCTQDGTTHIFSDPREFAKFVWTESRCNWDVYTNWSPESSTIRKVV